MEMRPIGFIRSPFITPTEMPIQPPGAKGIEGTVELRPEFAEGLQDLEGFSHIILLYLFDRSSGYELRVIPFLDDRPHGLFATRAPKRPNPIGFSVVALKRVQGSVLHIVDVDVLDRTPLLDIKPYVPAFDAPSNCRTGWLEESGENARNKLSDDRFH